MTRDLGWLDRFLWLWILLAMALGLLLGYYVPSASEWLNRQHVDVVSLPIFIGLVWMMYPILCKVPIESLPQLLLSRSNKNKRRKLLNTLLWSLLLNWVVGPFLMTGFAWMTLWDLPGYRTGVIMVGLARCIAMVFIWNWLADGDAELCALLVAVNSLLQILLYAPYAYVFVTLLNTPTAATNAVHVSMWMVAKNVLLFLGVPFVAAAVSRLLIRQWWRKQKFYDETFVRWLGPTALLGLLFTIVCMFTLQGHRIMDDWANAARTIVPLLLYFAFMFAISWMLCASVLQRSYEETVTQSFTAASNNFELAIAVAIGVWGLESEQALAAVMGPLVEVPVLLLLVHLARYLKKARDWGPRLLLENDQEEEMRMELSGVVRPDEI